MCCSGGIWPGTGAPAKFLCSCVGFLLGFCLQHFDDRSALEPIKSAIDDMIPRMGIAEHHCQAFVAGEIPGWF